MTAQFRKYHALGNDMLVIDPAYFSHDLTPGLIQAICRRHFGVGADGICYGPLPQELPRLAMSFFNPDGTSAEKSGNGLRIFARYLWDAGYVTNRAFTLYIYDQEIAVTIEDEAASRLTTTLGRLSFSNPFNPYSLYEVVLGQLTSNELAAGATSVNIGNPHCVLFVDSLSADRVRQIGPLLETAAPFPNRTNVQLVEVINPHTIQIEIWERGAGYTLASGTSASASAGAAIWNGRCQSPVEVRMAGGSVKVVIDEDWGVTLTGSVQAVYSGHLDPSIFELL